MPKHWIEDTISHQAVALNTISQAVTLSLFECNTLTSELQQKIVSGLRWGLFMKDKVAIDVKEKIQTTTVVSGDSQGDMQPLIQIDFGEIDKIQKMINEYTSLIDADIFSPVIKEFLDGKSVKVLFSYEEVEAKTIVSDAAKKSANIDQIMDVFELRLTLPEYDAVFDEITDIRHVSKTTLEAISLYEEWKWETEKKWGKDSYVQIGGHGSWIQGEYTHSYISQVNNDVGDAGSVFVCCDASGKFDAWVDMH